LFCSLVYLIALSLLQGLYSKEWVGDHEVLIAMDVKRSGSDPFYDTILGPRRTMKTFGQAGQPLGRDSNLVPAK
jgi:hypothetical protein